MFWQLMKSDGRGGKVKSREGHAGAGKGRGGAWGGVSETNLVPEFDDELGAETASIFIKGTVATTPSLNGRLH